MTGATSGWIARSAGSSGSSTGWAESGPIEEMGWKAYALAMLLFNLPGLLAVYAAAARAGRPAPESRRAFGAVSPDSSFNTAVSFATNTNWQGYGGETTMSYLTQMLALTVQNFVSAATGMAVAGRADPRLRAPHAQTIGNFWVDLTRTRCTSCFRCPCPGARPRVAGRGADVRPLCQGRRWSSRASTTSPVTDKDGKPVLDEKGQPKTKKSTLTEQVIAVGPAASQIAIKQLGTNGGGFFNVNSAHPFENPTPLSNFLEVLAILLIPAALCYTFGAWSGTRARAGRCWPR